MSPLVSGAEGFDGFSVSTLSKGFVLHRFFCEMRKEREHVRLFKDFFFFFRRIVFDEKVASLREKKKTFE